MLDDLEDNSDSDQEQKPTSSNVDAKGYNVISDDMLYFEDEFHQQRCHFMAIRSKDMTEVEYKQFEKCRNTKFFPTQDIHSNKFKIVLKRLGLN